MDMSSMSKAMVFTNSHTTPLYSTTLTPNSVGGYAGLCIFLIILASILRCLFAFKAILEQRWLAQALNRRYVVVAGRTPEAERVEFDPDAKTGTLVTAQGVEERVKVVRRSASGTVPWRFTVDLPRAAIVTVITGVVYLL